MKFTILTEEEFKMFTDKALQQSFFQTINMYHRYQNNGWETYLLGVKKDDKVIGAALTVSSYSKFGFKIFNIYKGYILDYNNHELVSFFTKILKVF